jgi:hypothetical protein
LITAGTMLRNMSQRVVNLSNEPEMVEQAIRRRASSKFATLQRPPSFPVIIEYGSDDLLKPPPIEKAPPPKFGGKSIGNWQQQPNPLKGNTLGIFPPDSHLRLWLCEILVHPVTEPLILVLIVIQTIVLVAENAQPLPFGTRVDDWGSNKLDFLILGLFILYTLEIVARIIVSGFIKNADEYSTLARGLTMKQAVMEKFRIVFGAQSSQPPKAHTSTVTPEFQPSILRSFTAIQGQPDQLGDSRHAMRVRVARRAYLRHSFTRLDLLAVLSFWISFLLSLFSVQSKMHLWVFEMLSCLRILRLMNLTSGTSVSARLPRE